MHNDKTKHRIELAREEIAELSKTFKTSFTIAAQKGFNRSRIRRWMAQSLGEIGICGVQVIYATDIPSGGKNNSLPIAWHIAIDRELKEKERQDLAEKAEFLRKQLSLGDKKYFFRWNVEHTLMYMLQHEYFDIQEVR